MPKIDWNSLSSKIRPETFQQVNAFRARHAALAKQVADLQHQLQKGINFEHYSVLNNKQVLEQAKKSVASFVPKKYDLSGQLAV